MGVEACIVLQHWDEETARAASEAAFERIEELNRALSDYLPRSESNRLVASPHTWVPVSDDLWNALVLSSDLTRRTRGSFDVTHGRLYHLWRAARRENRWPSEEDIERARAAGGWEKIDLDERTRSVRIRSESLELDFGGIGKGFAATEAARVLIARDCPYSLVDLGGDIVANFSPPGRDGWRIQIFPSPTGATGQGASGKGDGDDVIALSLSAIATSGDTEQFMVHEGNRYSHIIDPRTGYPLRNAPSVTVIAPTGALADALASAVSVLGADTWNQIAQEFDNVEVIVHPK